MRTRLSSICLVLVVLVVVSCAPGATLPPVAGPTATGPAAPVATALPPAPAATAIATAASTASGASPSSAATPAVPTAPASADLFSLISSDSLFATLDDLTAIQPYSGWRNSSSQGEREALDYVAGRLADLGYLKSVGLETERQTFRVPMGQEMWDSRLQLRVGGRDVDVPASGLRGQRENLQAAMNLDSDGGANDQDRDPIAADGPAVVIRTESELESAGAPDLAGKVVFLDDAVIDRGTVAAQTAAALASELLAKAPAGVVIVTQNSNELGQSHGFGIGDLSAFAVARWPQDGGQRIPVLYVRIEDLAPTGIQDWDGLSQVESARLTWDSDVSSPAESGNLVAHLPGKDPSRALILGAHIDSPNGPGAMDDGSGVAVLLEVARVLDAGHTQPPIDLYLAWFGSEELGLYGSSYFVSTHQDLLDRTVAMLEIDDLTRPLDGIPADLTLVTYPFGRVGSDRLPWPEALVQTAAGRGVEAVASGSYTPWSDNSPFAGFDVPNADLIYMDEQAMEATGSLHYAAHIHDPYDTVETAREVADVFVDMARIALAAVVDTAPGAGLRLSPPAAGRAVLVGSHTEAIHMTPAAMTDFGMALAAEGLDVDLVPYGQPVTAEDLRGAELVVVLPVVDYPGIWDDPGPYDEAWTAAEVDALEQYAAGGGLLVLANSANRLKYVNQVLDPNEDSADMNALASRFGVTFGPGVLAGGSAKVTGSGPLVDGLSRLDLAADNGVAFEAADAEVLAKDGGQAALAVLDYGQAGGQVIVLADVGMLGSTGGPTVTNMHFWRNLAAYALGR